MIYGHSLEVNILMSISTRSALRCILFVAGHIRSGARLVIAELDFFETNSNFDLEPVQIPLEFSRWRQDAAGKIPARLHCHSHTDFV